jgi:prevent-host-death family protein
MKTVGIVDLKARLSLYVKHAKAGNEVLVTERGQPVARLCPLSDAKCPSGRRQRLAAAGLLRLGRGRIRAELRVSPRGDRRAGSMALSALLAEREESR